MGSAVFFMYTMLMLAVCFGTACVSAFARASSGRRIFGILATLFLVYSVEVCEIFFYEFMNQGSAVTELAFYHIDNVWVRTFLGALAQGCIQMAAAELVGRSEEVRVFVVGVGFYVVSVLVTVLVPDGALQQWLYYTLRQVALAGTLVYLAVVYHGSKDAALRERLGKYRRAYVALWVLLACVVLEDVLVILVLPMGAHPVWALIFLSERNFSENVMACFMAYLTVRHALRLLSIRMREAPTREKVKGLEQSVDEQMELFRDAHGLSAREAEVLRLVVLGHSNHEIAGELFLAEGTVKKHVHNIMVKTGTKSRESLTLGFWRG